MAVLARSLQPSAGPISVTGALLVLTAAAWAQAPSAADLRVERQVDPLAIEAAVPRFSWIVVDGDRGAAQSAYRILVASTRAALDADDGDLWDSGKVSSSASTNVPYGGAPLPGDRRHWWKVRLWDEGDVQGPWSANARFDTGLTQGVNVAEFVWSASGTPNDFVYLRRSFDLAGTIEIAKLYVTAHDDYKLFVNGTVVGGGPAQNDPYDSMQVNAYEITSLLVPGENVIAARAHFHGSNSGCGVLGEPAFLLQARVNLTGGGQTIVATDSTWRVLDATPYDESAPFRGPAFAAATSVEDFDARLEPLGWTDTGFDDSGWASATVVTPGFQLEAQAVPFQTTAALIGPVLVTQPEAGLFLVDFGENRAGWPVLDVIGSSPGDEITIWYSEEVSGGRIVRDRDRIDDYFDVYTCRGDAVETWEPDVKYNGFQYVEVEGYPGTLTASDIRLRAISAARERAGDFTCSNALYQAIYDISVRTQVNCTQGVLVDNPQRELTQYSADGFIQAGNLFYAYRDANHVRKLLQDFRDSDLGGGVLLARHPTAQQRIIPEWTLFWIQALWLQQLHVDDVVLLQELYPTVQAVLAAFDAFRSGTTNLLENVPGNSFEFGELDTSGAALLPLNCLYHDALRKTADMASFLGLPADAQAYRNTAALVAGGIQTHLFDGVDRYRDSTGSTRFSALSSVLPLIFEITPEADHVAVFEYVKELGSPPDPVGAFYFYELLVRERRENLLHKLLDQTDEQWGEMVAAGATTTWEVFQSDFSLCHGWTAFPMQLFLSGIVGVRPTSSGFATWEIRPLLGPLTTAGGVVPTVKGDIVARWTRSSQGVTLQLTVPANTTAQVYLPERGFLQHVVTEGGKAIFREGTYLGGADGVSFGGNEPGFLRFDVGAGDFRFRLTGTPVDATPLPPGRGVRIP